MKSKTFIFKYDPESSMERLFTDLRQAWEGELKSVEPNIIRSNSIKALLHGLTEERLELFLILTKKNISSLKQLADYLNRDYQVVKKDAEILAAWGVIELKGEKPIALYEKIALEFPVYTKKSVTDKREHSRWI
ncbi:MAG: hypothetical protein I3273_07280 [Candidatus Moeniiplasma glomeromycotorum]|nr:hypothetical protein [Candidatus Moeniiplasma glomeromycotorum]MCE8168314.1 hypothetical protein [Candidatus Moeniiplasma glomeromycotorum]MCE8169888.1 hypothetical protein [Candidatus Moeniiplasma glomeromycotorum]